MLKWAKLLEKKGKNVDKDSPVQKAFSDLGNISEIKTDIKYKNRSIHLYNKVNASERRKLKAFIDVVKVEQVAIRTLVKDMIKEDLLVLCSHPNGNEMETD
jgi:hypothetical protein